MPSQLLQMFYHVSEIKRDILLDRNFCYTVRYSELVTNQEAVYNPALLRAFNLFRNASCYFMTFDACIEQNTLDHSTREKTLCRRSQ